MEIVFNNLEEWARRGPYIPQLLPDYTSLIVLNSLVTNLKNADYLKQTKSRLHFTIMYIDPIETSNHVQNLTDKSDSSLLYSDLSLIHTLSTTIFRLPCTANITQYTHVGTDRELLALKLDLNDEYKHYRSVVREVAKAMLVRSGLTDFEALNKDNNFKWLLTDSVPHITLGTKNRLELPDEPLKLQIVFDRFSSGRK